jgi:drug/metabolite transporter (DMT)-like permease
MTTTTPLFVTVVNDMVVRRIHKAFFVAAALAVAGGALIQLPDQSPASSIRGILLVQISNAAFACGQVLYKKWMAARPNLRDAQAFAFAYGGAALVAGACSLGTTSYSRLHVQPHQVLALLYLGILASGICFFLWNVGARKVNQGALAVMNNLKIPVGVFASLVLLGEATNYVCLLGGCSLFALALCLDWRYTRKHTI